MVQINKLYRKRYQSNHNIHRINLLNKQLLIVDEAVIIACNNALVHPQINVCILQSEIDRILFSFKLKYNYDIT